MSHLVREDGPLSHLNITLPRNKKLELFYDAALSPVGPWVPVKDQEDARKIANGVSAWRIMTRGKPRETQGISKDPFVERCSPTSPTTRSLQDHVTLSGSIGEPTPNQACKEKSKCPFASLSDHPPTGHDAFTGYDDSTPKRPDSLPTPPEWKEDYIPDPPPSNNRPQVSTSPPPSVTGSASKCPIRYIDERSPEEIARYFETHKHEIPRSHEVCVKRYQSNEESIRQLDAKYGNLVSMIQGLGAKHKPLMPTQEEQGSIEMERRSMEKVEKWAESVKSVRDNTSTRSAASNKEDDREGHFDRPLEEIRVGESPSRPWGIRVPIEREVASSASCSMRPSSRQEPMAVECFTRRSSASSSLGCSSKPAEAVEEACKGSLSASVLPGRASSHDRITQQSHRVPALAVEEETAAASNKIEAPYPSPPESEAFKSPPPIRNAEQPPMVFTGPVFIGYPAEQAAELIKQCGMGVNMPGA